MPRSSDSRHSGLAWGLAFGSIVYRTSHGGSRLPGSSQLVHPNMVHPNVIARKLVPPFVLLDSSRGRLQ